MIYNLPLSMILQKLTDIDNKLALLVENQPIDKPIDMLEEMQKEEYEDEHQGQSKVRNKANRRRSVPKKLLDKQESEDLYFAIYQVESLTERIVDELMERGEDK